MQTLRHAVLHMLTTKTAALKLIVSTGMETHAVIKGEGNAHQKTTSARRNTKVLHTKRRWSNYGSKWLVHRAMAILPKVRRRSNVRTLVNFTSISHRRQEFQWHMKVTRCFYISMRMTEDKNLSINKVSLERPNIYRMMWKFVAKGTPASSNLVLKTSLFDFQRLVCMLMALHRTLIPVSHWNSSVARLSLPINLAWFPSKEIQQKAQSGTGTQWTWTLTFHNLKNTKMRRRATMGVVFPSWTDRKSIKHSAHQWRLGDGSVMQRKEFSQTEIWTLQNTTKTASQNRLLSSHGVFASKQTRTWNLPMAAAASITRWLKEVVLKYRSTPNCTTYTRLILPYRMRTAS